MQTRCPYDDALLRRELQLFPTGTCSVTGVELHAECSATSSGGCDLLVGSALAQPRVFVHRDYMPRNLMLSEPNPGILDFQDAVHGPISYDVTSLFKDAFLSWRRARAGLAAALLAAGVRRAWRCRAESPSSSA